MRFNFGKNWLDFKTNLDNEQINYAIEALKVLLNEDKLHGKTLLDIGSGSGLMSLAAYRMGASVFSFDFDKNSVKCTQELKEQFNGDNNWIVDQGSILDDDYISKLGKFDLVYSWGVLHHTGDMWKALENAHGLVKENGKLIIAIYNDQGGASRRWLVLKKVYNKSPELIKNLIIIAVGIFFELRSFFIKLVRLENPLPFKHWKNYKNERGMSYYHDLKDWVGGYPFEYAKPEEIFNFYHDKGYVLQYLKTCAGSHGCNEFLFKR